MTESAERDNHSIGFMVKRVPPKGAWSWQRPYGSPASPFRGVAQLLPYHGFETAAADGDLLLAGLRGRAMPPPWDN